MLYSTDTHKHTHNNKHTNNTNNNNNTHDNNINDHGTDGQRGRGRRGSAVWGKALL